MKYRTFPDITGQQFGKITVLDGKLAGGKALIKCECGIEKTVSRYDVFHGKVKSCGAKQCVARAKDLTGQRFALLTVIREVPNDKDIAGRCAIWECQCECGTTLNVPSNQLNSGRTKSCGCAKGVWISRKNAIPIKERVENQVFSEYKRNATKRNLEFLLSKEDFVDFMYGECFYCGSPPANCMKKQKVTGEEFHQFNGVDRVNNEIGYTLDNCVSCCKLCNHAKKDLSKEEFIALAKKIASRFV